MLEILSETAMQPKRFCPSDQQRIRKALTRRDGHTCVWCGREMYAFKNNRNHRRRHPAGITIEHLHPRSQGGSDQLNNLALACRGCNELRGNLPLDEWLLIAQMPRMDVLGPLGVQVPHMTRSGLRIVTESYVSSILMQMPTAHPNRHQLSKREASRVRHQLLKRDGPSCVWCGDCTTDNHASNKLGVVAYLILQPHRGSKNLKNLAISCRDCQRQRGKQPLHQWLLHAPRPRLNVLKKASSDNLYGKHPADAGNNVLAQDFDVCRAIAA